MKTTKAIFAIILILAAFSACKKDGNTPQISVVGYYKGFSGGVYNEDLYEIHLLVRADSSARYYQSKPGVGIADTAVAYSKVDGKWSLAGNAFNIRLPGPDVDLQAIVAAPVINIQGDYLFHGKFFTRFSVVKNQ